MAIPCPHPAIALPLGLPGDLSETLRPGFSA